MRTSKGRTGAQTKRRAARRNAGGGSRRYAARHLHAAKEVAPAAALLRFVLVTVVLVALLLGANLALALCLQPYGGITEVTWWAYRQAGDELDTVFVGNSRTDGAVDVATFDKKAKAHSVCLSTVFQSLEDSTTAVQTALDEHDLKRVVLGVSASTFTAERHIQSSSTFTQAKALGEPPLEVVRDYAELLTSDEFFYNDKSITSLVPWTYSHVPFDVESVQQNVQNRLTYDNPIDANKHIVNQDLWRVDKRGDRHLVNRADFSWFGCTVRSSDDADYAFLDDNKQEFVRFLDVCAQHDVKVYVVGVPAQFFDLVAMGKSYPEQMSWVKAQVEAHGGTFLDFNMARQKLYAYEDEDWADVHHLNLDGSKRFSAALARTIARAEAGKNMEASFYSYDAWDDVMAAYDRIYLTGFSTESVEGGLSAELWSYAGTQVDVEYEVSVLDDKTGEYRVVSPYDTSTNRTWQMDAPGTYTVRVAARHAGADVDFERVCIRTDVTYMA